MGNNINGSDGELRKAKRQRRIAKVFIWSRLALLMLSEAEVGLWSGPSFRTMRRHWLREIYQERRRLARILWDLEHRGLIIRRGELGELTEKGRRRVRQIVIELANAPRQIPWDGRWHLVIFDVPEHHRLGRDLLRRKLRNLGCFQLQRSVFVYPYNIRVLVEKIREAYDLRSDIVYCVAETIERANFLKSYFQRRGILPD